MGNPLAKEPMKAKLVCLENAALSWDFKYNPKEFSLTRQGGFAAKSKADGPWGGIQWECAKPDELSFDIILDATAPDLGAFASLAPLALLAPISSLAALAGQADTNSVLPDIAALHQLTIPGHLPGQKDVQRPPYVAFLWGNFQFFGGISSIESKIILFDFGGIPKRAEVSIKMIGQSLHAPKDEFELAGGYGKAGDAFGGYEYKPLSAYKGSGLTATDTRLSMLDGMKPKATWTE
jgi:hypothetical protein